MRTLRNGSHGFDVEFMQRLLYRADMREHAEWPYFESHGHFNGEAERAIRAFQRRHPGLTADGVVGAQTWAALGLRSQREHSIRLYGQPDGTTCWSAAATMIMGTNSSVGAGGAGRTDTGRLGESYENIATFARSLGWRMPDRTPGIAALVSMLMRTPLWIGVVVDDGGGDHHRHAVVLSGVYSDGDPSGEGTMVRIHDPWPVRHGAIYHSFVGPIVVRDSGRRSVASLENLLIPS